jgi:BirA family biotin operon repressor/biotin-[acetyl-CoA-carboxylase] ligase
MKNSPLVERWYSIRTTRIFGSQVYHVAEIDSTNNFALEKARGGAPEGTVVLADHQSHGRGQGDHTWYSPRGGMYLSIILRPEVAPRDINSWNVMGGSAVARTLGDYVRGEISLRFPNDVLLDGKKVAGILTEMRGGYKHLNFLVMGIGLNVNFEMDQVPKELQPRVTSFRLEGPEMPARVKLLQKLLENLESYYLSFLEKREGDGSALGY